MANSYLTKTSGTPTSQKTGTFSFWVKRSVLGSTRLFNNHVTSVYYGYIDFTGGDQLRIAGDDAGTIDVKTNRVFRDTSAWYHIVIAIDSTQSTAADRVKVYVNGEQETSFATSTYQSQNDNLNFLSTSAANGHVVGAYYNGSAYSGHFNGYMSHVAFVDGTALTPTSFGETDSTSGVWKFRPPSGVTWGNNGFHLKFENSGNLGLDSANSNNFTVTGDLKQSISTPSNNYNTLNQVDTGYASSTLLNLANGATTTMNTSGFGDYGIRTNFAVSKGKWYWECKNAAVNGNGGNTMGLLKMSKRLVINLMSGSPTAGVYGIQRYSDSSINIHTNGSIASQNTAMFGGGFTTSDIIGFALDMDNGKLYISKNGAYKDSSGNTGNPATQAYPTFTGLSTGEFYSFYSEMRMNNDNGLQVNFGEGRFGTTAISSAGSNGNGALFEYDVPSGFYALNTKNINTYG